MPRPKASLTLSIKNFERFQHYKTRNPPWIRLYYAILDDPAFVALDEIQQCRLMKLFLIASKQENIIPYDPAYISKMLRIDGEIDITPLINSGFVLASRKHNASGPQAKPYSEAEADSSEADSSEAEGTERASTPPIAPPSNGNGHSRKSRRLHTEWPHDFRFNDKHKAIADGFGLNVHNEFIKFKDKCEAKGWTYKDWDAGFRTWLNNAVEFKLGRAH